MVKKNACIFISGKGTNLSNLIKKSRDYNFPINIRLVVTNNKEAKGIIHAKKNSIPYIVINTNSRYFENQIITNLNIHNISFICLAGYMKIISKNFLRSFKKNIINIHPSLLPKFKGLNTYKKILIKKEKKTGCTVHFVNEQLDSGQIITQKSFFIENNDNEETLKDKTQQLERFAFPEAIIKIYKYS